MALRNPEQKKLLEAMTRKRHKRKYNNKRVTLDGIVFDSVAEAARYVMLRDMESKCEVSCIHVHPTFKFLCGAKYVADFDYLKKSDKTGAYHRVVEDVKSGPTRTRLYLRNRKMMMHEYVIVVQEVFVDAKVAAKLVAAYGGTHGKD